MTQENSESMEQVITLGVVLAVKMPARRLREVAE